MSGSGPALRDNNRFIAMGRAAHELHRHPPGGHAAPRNAPARYLIADDRAIVYRVHSDRWDGIADLNNPPVARPYLDEFDEVLACELARRAHAPAPALVSPCRSILKSPWRPSSNATRATCWSKNASATPGPEPACRAISKTGKPCSPPRYAKRAKRTAWRFAPESASSALCPVRHPDTERSVPAVCLLRHGRRLPRRPAARHRHRAHVWLLRGRADPQPAGAPASPLVLRCIDDCLLGRRQPLDSGGRARSRFPRRRVGTVVNCLLLPSWKRVASRRTICAVNSTPIRERIVVGMSGGVDSSRCRAAAEARRLRCARPRT